MANSEDSALKRALMYDGGEHSFVSRGRGPSVECPRCGRTALSSQLLDAYYERRQYCSGVVTAQNRRAFTTV
jgi:hypothetical protein